MEQYVVDLNFRLSEDQIDALANLYQPVFSLPALQLYMTLYGFGLQNRKVTRREILMHMHIDFETLEAYRRELERFSLVRTFVGDNELICVLQKPHRPLAFLNHPSYGRLFAIVLGNDYFIETKARYAPLIDSDTENRPEISVPFDLNRLASWSHENEESFNRMDAKPVRRNQFDGVVFFKQISPSLFPVSMRTSDIIQLVEELGSMYNMSFADMKAHLLASANTRKKEFDKSKFILNIEKQYRRTSIESVENQYELDSLSFLAYKQNNDYVVTADKNLIKSLSQNFKFSHQIINVLIEHVLETNDQNLNRSYVEKIASTWQRQGVDSLEKALAICKPKAPAIKNQKPRVKKEAVNPVYDKTDDKVENIDEYDSYIEQFLKGDKS